MKRIVLCASLIAATGCGSTNAADITEEDYTTSTQALSPEGLTVSGTWKPLRNQPPFKAGLPMLLTNGTVMVQDVGTANWWRLTPDAKGSYLTGTWSQLASLPSGYAPLYFASAVLPDGRVLIAGGEYNFGSPVWTNLGAIYDPLANKWTSVSPPTGWSKIGDAQGVVLPDGRFLLANCCTTEAAIFNATTLKWTAAATTGKADSNNEEGWTLLPNGKVLTVDASNRSNLTNSEIYTPPLGTTPGKWATAGSTIVQLPDLTSSGGGSHEIGPAILRPDGSIFAAGATGHNAIYQTATSKWSAGPDFPTISGAKYDMADGAAAITPNGNVLLGASPGVFKPPVRFFEFNGTSVTEVATPPNSRNVSSYNVGLLNLPTGEILMTDFSKDVELYTAVGTANPAWLPSIDAGAGLSTLQRGKTFRLPGKQLSGLTSGNAYGDEGQAPTNYPLVRITNRASGNVFFARTHDHTSMSVAPGTASATSFDIPATAELGASDLVVVVNGLTSASIPVTITL